MSFFHIQSEISELKKVLVHSPDNGLGKVVPSKAQDWLFEDIVHLNTMRRGEYDYYTKLLLYFLDPEKIKGRLEAVDADEKDRSFYQPGHPGFHASENVIELQWLLAQVLEDDALRTQVIAAVCALEGCTHDTQQSLMGYSPVALASSLLSGTGTDRSTLFAPIPNFIFTRDIGIVVKDHLILNKPAKIARHREALLARYIFFYHPLFRPYTNKIIELHQQRPAFLMPEEQDQHHITLEGGDLMMISPGHLIIGISERTTAAAAGQLTDTLFKKKLVNKVTFLKIPSRRDFMHIDTVFTQVSKDTWVMMGLFSEQANREQNKTSFEDFFVEHQQETPTVFQFCAAEPTKPKQFSSLEALLRDISIHEFGASSVRIIFSGNNEYPYAAREQWTDSCNLLALKEGVVLSYDRNDKTNAAFEQAGFQLISVQSLLQDFESGKITPGQVEQTVVLMPSAELSRARGGFHCMSMPLQRG